MHMTVNIDRYIEDMEQWKKAREENERLQDRIDKAIEYIKNCQLGCDFAYRPFMLEDTPSGEDLLNILRGKDNE